MQRGSHLDRIARGLNADDDLYCRLAALQSADVRAACFAINAVLTDGSRANLSDGGMTDWTARLLADRKERLLISGLGSERLIGVAAVE